MVYSPNEYDIFIGIDVKRRNFLSPNFPPTKFRENYPKGPTD